MSYDDIADDEWSYLEDDEENQGRIDFLDQCLDSPLTDTALIKLMSVANKTDLPSRIRPGASIREETTFIAQLNDLTKVTTFEPYSVLTVLKFIAMIRSIQENEFSHPPMEVPITLTQAVSSFLKEKIGHYPRDLSAVTFDDATLRYYTASSKMQELLDRRRAKSLKGDNSCLMMRGLKRTWVISNRYCALIDKTAATLMTFDMFLCLVDIARLRSGCLIAAAVLGKDGVDSRIIEQQYRWQESVLIVYGNEGYEIVKAPETLFRCWSSRISGGSLQAEDSYHRMLEKIRNKERKLGRTSAFLIDQFDRHHAQLVKTVDVAAELFGLIKGSGHPIINPIIGGESSRSFGKGPDKSKLAAVEENWYIFQHLILTNYLKTHGSWPPMTFTKGTQLKEYWKKGILFITDGSYSLDDWNFASIDQIFDFDCVENYMDLLTDKACAPQRSLMYKIYSGMSTDTTLRRILKNIIIQPKLNTVELVTSFMRNQLSPDDLNIMLAPKEKEFKLAARMYCLMTFKVRVLLSIIQYNVKETFFKLLPYQSMTMDQNELHQKLLNMTTPSTQSDHVFIEIDLARWNLCFRDFFVRGLGSKMDKMHGVENTFGRVHQLLRDSLVTVLVRDEKIPGFTKKTVNDDSNLQWMDHQGGFEGIDQATWTICTITMIYRALWLENCRFILLGQGDNQTLAITRMKGSSQESFSDFVLRIMEKIQDSCDDVNHEAKPEEFVESTTTLTYSKLFIVKGRIVPMELKFAQSIAPLTSSDIPSLGDAIGAVFSSAVGSAMNAVDPLRHWQLALIHASDTLRRFKRYGGWFGDLFKDSVPWRITPDIESLMLSIPSVIGGFPICSWTSFMIRHDPDPLGAALSSLRAYKNEQWSKKYYTLLLTESTYRTDNMNLQKLVQDPFSLPFINPSSQASTLEESARSWLQYSTRNVDIKSLFSTGSSKASKKLLESLTSMRPFFPTVAHDIWKISLGGKLEEVTKAFTMTKTISNGGRNFSLHWKLINTEMRSIRSVFSRFRDSAILAPTAIMIGMNSFELSERLRGFWKLGAGAIQGVSVYHPLDFDIRPTVGSMYGVTSTVDMSAGDPMDARGSHRAFLGGKTRERREGKKYEILKDTNVLELQKLVSASTAGGISINFRSALDIVARSRSTFSLNELEQIFPHTIGGTIAHRYEQLGKDGRIAPVGNPNLMTNLVLCSDNVPGISGTKDDYPIAFQQFFVFLASFHRQLILSSDIRGVYPTLVCQVASDSLKKLEQEEIKAVDKAIPFDVWKIVDNPLVFIKGIKLRQLKAGMPEKSSFTVKIADYITRGPRLRFLLINLIINEAVKRSPTAYRLDDHDLSDSTIPPFDTVVFDAIGEKMLLECTVTAGVILVIATSVQTMGPRILRHSISGLSEKWASILSDLWAPHLSRCNAELDIVEQQLINLQSSGHERKSRLSSFITLLQQSILVKVLTPTDEYIQVPLAYFSRSPKYLLGSPISCAFAVFLWGMSYKTSQSNMSVAIKDELRKMRAALSLGSGPFLDADDLTRSQLKYFLTTKGEYMEEINPIWYNAILSLAERGAPGFDLSTEEIWRALRATAKLPEKPRPVFKRKFNYVETTSTLDGRIKFTLRSWGEARSLQIDRIKKDGKAFDPRKMIADHLTIQGGVYSSDGILWGKVTFSQRERVLVVGTGSGGIQTYLSSLGIINIGCDAQANTPKELLGKLVYYPLELSRFRVPHGMYAAESELTSLNFYDAGVYSQLITKYDISTTVIDLEPIDHHLGLEVYHTYSQSGMVGRLLVKHVLLKSELEQLIAILSESSGIKITGAYRLSTFSLSDSYRVKCVLDCRVTHGFRISKISKLECAITDQGLFKAADLSANPIVEANALLTHMTAGYITDVKDIPRSVTRLRTTLKNAEASGRGQMSTKMFFDHLLAVAVGELLLAINSEHFGSVINILYSRYSKGSIIETGTKRFRLDSKSHRNYNQAILREIPRLLAVSRRIKNV